VVQETTVTAPPQRPEPDDQLGLRLLRGRRGHGGLVLTVRVLPTALLLSAVHLLLTGSRLSRSWWYQDDLNLLASAADRALTPDLLFSNYNGHLVPGSWLIAWVLDRVAPLQWWPAALLTLLIVAATDLMMLALLRRLFGSRPAILVPFAMYCATSLVLTSTLWWAASQQWLPVSLSLVTALWFHVGYLRTRRRRDAIGALLAVLFGLAFFEKAVTTPVLLALFTVAYAVPGALWRRPWRAFRQYWAYWLAHAALAGGYTWLYLARVTIDAGPGSKAADVLEVTRLMILETLLPSLIGGPLNWYSTPESTIISWPHPSPVLVVTAAVLTAVAVLGSLLFVRGAWRAWLLLAVYLGISVLLVARVRLGFIGPFIGRDHRYLTDLAVVAPLALALAWLPLRGGLDAVLAQPARTSRRAERRRERSERFQARLARRRGAVAATAAIAVVVITAGGVISGERFMTVWSKNPAEAYFGNLSADLRAHSGPVYLFGDEVVPDLIMTPTFLENRQIGRVTRALEVRPIVREAVPHFSVVDPSGHVHDGAIRGTDVPIPRAICATATAPGVVQLPSAPGAGRWKLRLGYYTNRQTSARVAIGSNPPVEMRLERGLHEVYVSLLAGRSTQLRMDGVDAGASVCIGAVTVGFPVIKS
jgi:hypothetical protein